MDGLRSTIPRGWKGARQLYVALSSVVADRRRDEAAGSAGGHRNVAGLAGGDAADDVAGGLDGAASLAWVVAVQPASSVVKLMSDAAISTFAGSASKTL